MSARESGRATTVDWAESPRQAYSAVIERSVRIRRTGATASGCSSGSSIPGQVRRSTGIMCGRGFRIDDSQYGLLDEAEIDGLAHAASRRHRDRPLRSSVGDLPGWFAPRSPGPIARHEREYQALAAALAQQDQWKIAPLAVWPAWSGSLKLALWRFTRGAAEKIDWTGPTGSSSTLTPAREPLGRCHPILA